MTYIKRTINDICLHWCPICDECPLEHHCSYMEEIQKNIMKIAGFNEDR